MDKISIVIPCRNEVLYIEECIRAIYNADLPEFCILNVFVVDGMSDDGTRALLNKLKKEFSSLKIVNNQMQLTPFAFNLGIHEAECDFVQIIGARHIISKNYLSNCYNTLISDKSVWCVGGKITNEYINNTGRVIATAMGTKLGMGIGNFRTLKKSCFTDTVTSPMYPFWVFEKIGFFDEELIRNQDDDFNYRISKAGGKIYFDASISLKYYVRGDFKKLWRQFFQYGYWKVYVNQKHKAITTIRQLIPPFFVVYLFTFLLSFLFDNFVGSIFSIPFLVYLIAVSYTSFMCHKKDKSISFNSIFKTFPILHVSYGTGYLKGIWEFLLFNKKPNNAQKRMSR